jgi:hypothetical protein
VTDFAIQGSNEARQYRINGLEELNQLEKDITARIEALAEELRQDEFERRIENFKTQKEITLLQRDKLNMEKEIGESLIKLAEVENKIFGRELFNLEAVDEHVENITELNLRPEARINMSHMETIH